MNSENADVQNNLNAFSASISAGNVDHREVLIGDPDEITVAPPLGGSDRFLHIAQEVGSHDALELLLSTLPLYSSFLRPDAKKHIVIVTDDESDTTGPEFLTAMEGAPAEVFGLPGEGWSLHSVAPTRMPDGDLCSGASGSGDDYLELSAATNGTTASICGADFSAVFTELEAAVQVSVAVPCVFGVPEAPDG